MTTHKKLLKIQTGVTIIGLLGFAISCGGDKKDDNGGGYNPGQLAIEPTANLQGAYGLLVLDDQESSGLRLMEKHNETVEKLGLRGAPTFSLPSETQDGLGLSQSPTAQLSDGTIFSFPGKHLSLQNDQASDTALQKIGSDGEIHDAMTVPEAPSEVHQPDLPRISTIAVAPTGEVYLHFERSFQYRAAPPGEDAWDMANGYQCQIFKIKGANSDTLEDLLTNAPSAPNLECVDNQHFIDGWRRGNNSVFQFDASGNIFYPGSIPNNGRMVVYKLTRDGSSLTEVINSQICVQNFLITSLGGVFYTGNTCDDDYGGGSGFFRYVAPEGGAVVEIARDWWDFIFDTNISETSDGATDKAIFFGPDPRSATTASWDSACLFDFDPSKSDPSQRVSEVITCGSDIWAWLNLSRSVDRTTYGDGYHNGENNPSTAWRREFKRRCETDDEVFAGGGSQISSIKQDSTGQVFVIGNIRKKIAGTVSCNIEVKGPHCVIDGAPILYDSSNIFTDYDTAKSACQSNSGTWVDEGWCSAGSGNDAKTCIANGGGNDGQWRPNNVWYDSVESSLCAEAESGNRSTWWNDTNLTAAAASQAFIVNWLNCNPEDSGSYSGGDQWTNEYKALAKVNKDSQSLNLLSLPSEQAIGLWLVNDKPYYSSFDAQLGQYLLNGLVEENQCIDTSKSAESDCSGSGLAWTARQCINANYTTQSACENAGLVWSVIHPDTIISNFETYNLAETAEDGQMYADGLDFQDNSYKFGTVDIAGKELFLKEGLTGTLRTIVIIGND